LTLANIEKLEKWFIDNQGDPFPSSLKKKWLADECVLETSQISYWLSKRRKGIFTKENPNRLKPYQKKILRLYFVNNSNMPSRDEFTVLSKKLSLPKTKIAKWFASERHRNKKKFNSQRL